MKPKPSGETPRHLNTEPIYRRQPPEEREPIGSGPARTALEKFHFFVGGSRQPEGATVDPLSPREWVRRKRGYVSEAGHRVLHKMYREFTGNPKSPTYNDFDSQEPVDPEELTDNDRWAIDAYTKLLATMKPPIESSTFELPPPGTQQSIRYAADAARTLVDPIGQEGRAR